jgi:hypothetical protein
LSDSSTPPDTDRRRVRCTECGLVVNEREAESEGWRYWSDVTGELLLFCADCSRREFGV